MAEVTRVVLDRRAIEAVGREPYIRRALLDGGEAVAARAYVGAPKDTGAGAESIRAEAVLDGPVWEVRISWDREHYYMYFHERGTESLPARPFLEPALEAIIR